MGVANGCGQCIGVMFNGLQFGRTFLRDQSFRLRKIRKNIKSFYSLKFPTVQYIMSVNGRVKGVCQGACLPVVSQSGPC